MAHDGSISALTSVEALAKEYKLDDSGGNLNAKPHYTFVQLARHGEVRPIANLPHILDEDYVYYLVRSDVDLGKVFEDVSSPRLIGPIEGQAHIPSAENDWTETCKPDDPKIGKALN